MPAVERRIERIGSRHSGQREQNGCRREVSGIHLVERRFPRVPIGQGFRPQKETGAERA